MQEKKITMNDAFQVWWFIGWRTGLTFVVINILVNILMHLIPIGEAMSKIVGAADTIISVLLAVYYVKLAINRNYKGFRLSSVEK